MPSINQTKALEAAAQRLAAHTQQDYSRVRMVDHYLQRVSDPDPAVAALVAEADAIVRPLLDAITDLEADGDLLRHRLRTCHAEARNLGDYVRTMPGRLPAHLDGEFAGVEFRAWLQEEIRRAPLPIHQSGSASE